MWAHVGFYFGFVVRKLSSKSVQRLFSEKGSLEGKKGYLETIVSLGTRKASSRTGYTLSSLYQLYKLIKPVKDEAVNLTYCWLLQTSNNKGLLQIGNRIFSNISTEKVYCGFVSCGFETIFYLSTLIIYFEKIN